MNKIAMPWIQEFHHWYRYVLDEFENQYVSCLTQDMYGCTWSVYRVSSPYIDLWRWGRCSSLQEAKELSDQFLISDGWKLLDDISAFV